MTCAGDPAVRDVARRAFAKRRRLRWAATPLGPRHGLGLDPGSSLEKTMEGFGPSRTW